MNRTNNIPYPEKENLEYLCPSASWGDMTGLIPANPTDEETRKSYNEIYPYIPQDN